MKKSVIAIIACTLAVMLAGCGVKNTGGTVSSGGNSSEQIIVETNITEEQDVSEMQQDANTPDTSTDKAINVVWRNMYCWAMGSDYVYIDSDGFIYAEHELEEPEFMPLGACDETFTGEQFTEEELNEFLGININDEGRQKEVLSKKSPIFGRRDSQIKLEAFNYRDSALFVPEYSAEEKAICYGVTGGVAKYLTLFDDTLTLDQNLIKHYFTTSGYLYEEPYNLLMQEFRTVNTYNSVIEACSNGANKVKEIADKTHESTATLSYVLKNLMTVGVISKVFAITDEKNKKKVSYEITDGMYRFWYRFVPMARAAIEMDRGDIYYNKYVKGKLHEFMGEIFEYMCRYYTLSKGLQGELKCFVTNTGKWWGTGHDRKPTDIDVVGIDNVSNQAIFGECKFKNEPVDKAVYDRLMARKGLIDRKYSEVQYAFFSLSGYSEWVKENADTENVKLFTLEDLYC